MNAKQIIRAEIFSLVGIMTNRNIVDLFLQRNLSWLTTYRAIEDCNYEKDWSYKKSSGKPLITSKKRTTKWSTMQSTESNHQLALCTENFMYHISIAKSFL